MSRLKTSGVWDLILSILAFATLSLCVWAVMEYTERQRIRADRAEDNLRAATLYTGSIPIIGPLTTFYVRLPGQPEGRTLYGPYITTEKALGDSCAQAVANLTILLKMTETPIHQCVEAVLGGPFPP
jgi:hypothetical protein